MPARGSLASGSLRLRLGPWTGLNNRLFGWVIVTPYLDKDKEGFLHTPPCHGTCIYVPFNIGALSTPLLRLVVLPTIPTVPKTSSGLVSTFLPAVMTNFDDPKVVQADASALPLPRTLARNLLTGKTTCLCSGFCQASACDGGSLHVSQSLASILFRVLISGRWEYFTTIWFEWQIIRGKRRCRWTIWVWLATIISW
jgi:hypothetical protein